MSILDTIFESYLAGDLSVQPESVWVEERQEFLKLAEKFKLNAEQTSELKDLLLDVVDSEGKKYFSAGFRLAVEMMSEMLAKSDSNIAV